MILVVDDDPVIRLLIEEYLTALGYTVTVAGTGQDFLQRFSSATPTLCVIDMQLPDATGIDLLRTVRADAINAQVPVLILSANSDAAALLKGAGLTYEGIISKPFEPREFAATVKKLLLPR